MRPVVIILFPILSIWLFVVHLKNIRLLLKTFFIFISFLLVFEAFWIPINYKRFHLILPLTKARLYSNYYKEFHTFNLEFVYSYGGKLFDDNLINPQIDSIDVRIPFLIKQNFSPSFDTRAIYTSAFNHDSLLFMHTELLKNDSLFNSHIINSISHQRCIFKNINKIQSYTKSIKKEKPFLFYFLSYPVILARFFSQDLFNLNPTYATFHGMFPGNTYLPRNNMDFYFKHYWNFLYSSMLFLGILGILLYFRKNLTTFFLTLITVSLLLVYPIVFRAYEWRYLVTAYPFLVLMATPIISLIFNFFLNIKARIS